MALVAGMSLFAVSCSDDTPANENGGDNGGNEETYVLDKDITENLTLETGKSYTLNGGIHVKPGVTLTIQPGVTLTAKYDDKVDYILVEQGAKIDAQGTASQPIIMTSEKKEPGAWGGLHICGYAHTNNGTGSSEIGNAAYGGSDDSDNSGILRYIRLEYTGYAFDEEHEANGVSFYGVGNGTTVEHLQAYMGSDDGFEFFGGSVNVKYLVATDCSDDSFDWTEGWNGKGQYLVAYQANENELGYACDCLMECDNNGTNYAASPVAHPVLSNITLVGNGSDSQGMRLRAGTEVELYNAIIVGKGKPLTVETAETENALKNGTSKLEYVTISGELSSKENIYTNADFVGIETNQTNVTPLLTNYYVGTVAGGTKVNDSFFDTTEYRGAVPADNDWTAGWTLTSGTEAAVEPETLQGELTGEKISLHNEREGEKLSPYNTAYFVLNDNRDRLYERIDRRVDQMLENGLVEEVRRLAQMGYTRDMVSMQGLGYKEILAYLDGECTLEEAVYVLKRDTRHFAKRQLTWFRREQEVIWVNKPDFDYDDKKILEYILENCKKRGIL